MKVLTTVATLLAAFLVSAPRPALASAHENDKVTEHNEWPREQTREAHVTEVPVLDRDVKIVEPAREVARNQVPVEKYENGRR